MEKKCCKDCGYYRQHYALDKQKIFRVYFGHCIHSKVKTKKPDAKICEHYIQTEPDENAFVSKEYLSKALLAYMLKLELLPKIGEQTEI